MKIARAGLAPGGGAQAEGPVPADGVPRDHQEGDPRGPERDARDRQRSRRGPGEPPGARPPVRRSRRSSGRDQAAPVRGARPERRHQDPRGPRARPHALRPRRVLGPLRPLHADHRRGQEQGARLTTLGGKRIASGKDFDPDTGKLKRDDELLTAASAKELKEKLEAGEFTILSAEEKPFRRAPRRPSRPRHCSRGQPQAALRRQAHDARGPALYENGFITYMRTDSVTLSTQAIELTRAAITETYGGEFVPDEPRLYKGKSQNAQEPTRPSAPRARPSAASTRPASSSAATRPASTSSSGSAPSPARWPTPAASSSP